MGTKDVRIDTRLNKAIWSQGVRGVPFRMRIHLDVSHESVQLVDAVLVLVPEPGQADPHPEGDAPHSLGPDGLVKPGVDPHVLGAHLLLSKLLDFLDGAGSAVLEPDSVEPLVEVDGVLAGHDLAHGGPS